jgi:hypothetical protein
LKRRLVDNVSLPESRARGLGVLARWRRQPSDERLAKRREKEAKEREKERARVFEQLRAAGITRPRGGGGDGLLSEPVLVFRGSLHGDFEAFDQNANTVGVARHGNHGGLTSELHDADGTLLLDIKEGEWWLFFACTFVVKGHDGEDVAEFLHPRGGRPRWPLSHTAREITSPAGTLGCFKQGRERSTVENPVGNEVAWINRKSAGEYVVEIAPSVGGPLRAAAVAGSIVYDLATRESNT